MKTKRWMAMVLVMLGVMLSLDALAFYNSSTGRWLSRDPIEEKGGINMYCFVGNQAVDWVDIDGRGIRRGGKNCQVDAWQALKNCCGKSTWNPSWYIDLPDGGEWPPRDRPGCGRRW